MTSFKRILINSCIVVGNIFLSHGLFFVLMKLIDIWSRFENRPMHYQQMVLIALCAVQIAVNIILYKLLLKRYFKPIEQRKKGFYFLLPVIGIALWIGSMVLTMTVDFGFDIETYTGTLISFLPVILLTLILLAVVYRLFFYKYVGEAYCVYTLSVLGVLIIPITILILIPKA